MLRHLMVWTASVTIAMASLGCGPVQFVSQVTIRAEKAVTDAKIQKADRLAPYEYYGAEAYLEQAKHRAGFGDFQTAYRYGQQAESMANKAAGLAKQRREEERDETRPSESSDAPTDAASPRATSSSEVTP